MRRVSWRLMPFLTLAYLLCYIDRVNVGFASLQMNKAVGIDPKTYGLGAGIFSLATSSWRCQASGFATIWRAYVDCAHHADMGGRVRGVCFDRRPHLFPGATIFIGGRGSRLLSWGHPLSHLLVSDDLGAILRRADQTRDRNGDHKDAVWHNALPLAWMVLAMLGTFFTVNNLWMTVVLLTLIAAGTYASKGPFWALSSEWLGPTAAAAGLAQINALGNFSGFFFNYMIGWIKEETGSFPMALMPIAVVAATGTICVLTMGRNQPRTTPVVTSPACSWIYRIYQPSGCSWYERSCLRRGASAFCGTVYALCCTC
jgi:hypothetical protein